MLVENVAAWSGYRILAIVGGEYSKTNRTMNHGSYQIDGWVNGDWE